MCDSYPGTAALEEFIDQKLNKDEDDEEFNYCQRNLIAGTATLEEFTDQKLNKDEDDEEFNYCQ